MSDSGPHNLDNSGCPPIKLKLGDFNQKAKIPYGLTIEHLFASMNEFVDFLGFINQRLLTEEIPTLECMLMPANFSSIVGEFMTSTIPKHCKTIVKNQYHNGHPDMVPAGKFLNDSIQHSTEGIEIKGSRYLKGWQGHNPEDTWLMVFCFDSSRPIDAAKSIPPKPFEFLMVVGAQLEKADWTFSGRSETSRRTITASINRTGYEKMRANWLYMSPKLKG